MSVSKERAAAAPAGSETKSPPSFPISAPTQTAVRRELETVLESPEFRGSHRGQMLLRHLVENSLDGAVERLKERTLGVELFHRDADYDTGQDAIVRVAANDVRKRLTTHYQQSQSSPSGTAVRISLAPGSYIPDFEVLEKPPVPPAPPGIPVIAKMGSSKAQWIPWAIAGVLAVVCALLGFQNLILRRTESKQPRTVLLPWSQIASSGATIELITADSNFAFYKSAIRSDRPLHVYTSEPWLDELGTRVPMLPGLKQMPLTSIGDVIVAARLGGALQSLGSSVAVRSGRMVQIDDFKSDRPVILLGAQYANPWVSLVSDRLNFHIDYDPASGKQICVNRNPRAGESAVYIGTARTPMPGVGYAIVSLVRNLSHSGFVLLIAGTNMEGTEAAGEFVTDLPRVAGELRKRDIDPSMKVEQLELLMRLDHMGTQWSRSEIIAHRVTQ